MEQGERRQRNSIVLIGPFPSRWLSCDYLIAIFFLFAPEWWLPTSVPKVLNHLGRVGRYIKFQFVRVPIPIPYVWNISWPFRANKMVHQLTKVCVSEDLQTDQWRSVGWTVRIWCCGNKCNPITGGLSRDEVTKIMNGWIMRTVKRYIFKVYGNEWLAIDSGEIIAWLD